MSASRGELLCLQPASSVLPIGRACLFRWWIMRLESGQGCADPHSPGRSRSFCSGQATWTIHQPGVSNPRAGRPSFRKNRTGIGVETASELFQKSCGLSFFRRSLYSQYSPIVLHSPSAFPVRTWLLLVQKFESL